MSRLGDELGYLRAVMQEPGEEGDREAITGGSPVFVGGESEYSADFLAMSGQIIVDDPDVDRVSARIVAWGLPAPQMLQAEVPGVALLGITGDVEAVCERIDREMGLGTASPNHMLNITPWLSLCPETEPVVAHEDDCWPPPSVDSYAGAGVRVCIVDTGFLKGAESRSSQPWLSGIASYDVDEPNAVSGVAGAIDPYAGHGTFISGVLRCIAPQTDVTVDGAMRVAGVVDEISLALALMEAIQRNPDVIHFGGGGYSRKGLPPKTLVAIYDRVLRHYGGCVVVAPAGNDADRAPFWPAAFPWAIGVGATTRDGLRRASFSNYGSWVDVFAPGEDLVNSYAEGTYTCVNGGETRQFTGMARWSGTSFSAPIVTGLIAARMSRTGETAQQAASALMHAARAQHLPGIGPRLLV